MANLLDKNMNEAVITASMKKLISPLQWKFNKLINVRETKTAPKGLGLNEKVLASGFTSIGVVAKIIDAMNAT